MKTPHLQAHFSVMHLPPPSSRSHAFTPRRLRTLLLFLTHNLWDCFTRPWPKSILHVVKRRHTVVTFEAQPFQWGETEWRAKRRGQREEKKRKQKQRAGEWNGEWKKSTSVRRKRGVTSQKRPWAFALSNTSPRKNRRRNWNQEGQETGNSGKYWADISTMWT